jgi:hypothetical protein
MKRLAGGIGIVALVAAAVVELHATTARRMSNRELAETAQIIVIGQASDSRPAWEGRTLVTLVTVKVTELIKGDPGASVTVALPGGIDANRKAPIAMTFAGAPTIKPGEEVFLFLGRDDDVSSGYVVLGFSQGKFSVAQEPNGAKVVSRDLTQIMLQGGTGTVPGAISYTALADFRNEIIGYVK